MTTDHSADTGNGRNDARISSKQIGIVMGLVVAVASGVALFLNNQHGDHLETIERIHNQEIGRLETLIQAAADSEVSAIDRADRQCSERVAEMKDSWTSAQRALTICLGNMPSSRMDSE